MTLDKFAREDDAGNISDLSELNVTLVNNKLSITRMSEEELKQLKRMKRHNKLKVKNHGDDIELKE